MTWKNKLGWAALIAVIIIASLGVIGFLTLRSRWFHEYLLTQIEQQASESIGGSVEIRNFDFHLRTLTADAYGIVIHGSEAGSVRPLVSADQLTIRLKVVSLFRKKVDLNEIILRHPVVSLLARKDGTTNLPKPPKKENSSSTNIFDLGIRHVLLTNGEVYYNDVKTPLDAELHDLQLEIKSRLVSDTYDGSLTYRGGQLKYGTFRPVPHDLNATFAATRDDFQLKPLVMHVAGSSLELQARVSNFSNLRADGEYRFLLKPHELRDALRNPLLPAGQISLAGSLHYQYDANTPMARTIVADGQLESRELAIDTPQLRTVIGNLQGHFQLANANLQARIVQLDLLGGRLSCDVNVLHLDRRQAGKVSASLQNLSVDQLKAALRSSNLRQLPVSARLSGTANGSWLGSIQQIEGRSDISLSGALASANPGAKPVPLNGAVHVTYDAKSSLARIENTYLRTPRTQVAINGSAGQRLNLALQAHAADLRELDRVVSVLKQPSSRSASQGQNVTSLNLAGAADVQASVQGKKENPQIRGRIRGRNLQYANSHWQSLQADLTASKSGVTVENGSLVNARQGYVAFALAAGLSNWSYLPSSPINVQLTSRGLAIAQLLQLANLNYPVSGNLSADISIHGSQLNPVGNGSVNVNQAQVYGQPLKTLSLRFTENGDAINSELNAGMSAGTAKATALVYPKTKAYEFQLSAPGIDLSRLRAVQEHNVPVSGVLTASASGRGTLDKPQLAAIVQVPRLQVQQSNIAGLKAELNLANQVASLALDSEVAQTAIRARGTVDLDRGYYTKATFDTKAIPIEGLLALYMPVKSNAPRGLIELHASVEGPLKEKERLRAEVVIPTLKASYQQLQIGNTRPVHIRYANSIVVLDPTEFAGTDSHLRVQGQMPLRGDAPVTMAASGTIDMQLLKFLQTDIQSSGKVLLDVRGVQSKGHPAVQGQVRVQNVGLRTPDAPVGIENLNGVLDINNDQVRIAQLTGKAGGGEISATGLIGYRPNLQMNVVLKADKVRVRYQDAVRLVFDSELNLVGTTESSALEGKVTLNSLGFTQDFDLAGLASQFQSGTESAPTTGGFTDNMKLNIAVQSSTNLNLTSSTVDVRGQANLRVVGTASDPVIVGRTELAGGEIFLMNKRFQIQRGIIEFLNPSRTEPVVNLLLTTTINQYNLSLSFIGPLDKMRTTYVSDPSLPTADIINLIARGQTTQQAASSPSNFGASSLIAEGVASQVSGGIQKLAGLSSLTIDPTLGGNNTNPGARIAFQKRVTKSFFFTFATDVTSTQREIIQGEYQFNRRWSASVTRDENGGFAVDGKYHTSF